MNRTYRKAGLFSVWSVKHLYRIDFRVLPVIFFLMCISILIIGSHSTAQGVDSILKIFSSPQVKKQIEWFALSTGVFMFFAGFDYNKLRELSWVIYLLALLALAGLFFTGSIARVHRWYRIPFIGVSIQPSEYAKLAVVISLSWFLERRKDRTQDWSTALLSGLIVGIPFLLILKQPDLGSALVLYPITLVMFYYGGLNPLVIRIMTWFGAIVLTVVALFFLEVVSHEQIRPYATKVMKDYQYDRLQPNNHHQKASLTAIAVGGLTGTGWKKSEYTGGGWLPAPYTDSVFPAFGEEFGFFGLALMMVLFYALVYFSFQVTAAAKDHFGRLLSAGISVYLAMHILVNVGMMCGLLPITGVPLILVTYGGSSVLLTMTALGILQSIYSRRFMF
jgi:rod shape determining protein RodA